MDEKNQIDDRTLNVLTIEPGNVSIVVCEQFRPFLRNEMVLQAIMQTANMLRLVHDLAGARTMPPAAPHAAENKQLSAAGLEVFIDMMQVHGHVDKTHADRARKYLSVLKGE